MSWKYPHVSISLSANEVDKLISYLRPVDQDSHLAKKLLSARERYDVVARRVDRAERAAKDPKYNWKGDGTPGGCDAHCIPHPCGPCREQERTA